MSDSFSGIVIYKKDYRERDALVKIFTQEYGFKMFFIKNYHRANHPLHSILFPLTYNQYVGTIHADGLSFIREGVALNRFLSIRQDLTQQAHASYLAQLFDASIEDQQADHALFQLFLDILQAMTQGKSAQLLTIYGELHLLQRFGIYLHWQGCKLCGRLKGELDFSMALQGVLCQQHYLADPRRLHLSSNTVKVLILMAQTPLSQINNIQVRPETLKEMRYFMDQIYQEFVGIRLRSKSFLEQIERFQGSLKPSSNEK